MKHITIRFLCVTSIFLVACKSSGTRSGQLQSYNSGEVIEIYSGTFDPPHLGHALVAAGAVATLNAKKIYVIPNPANPSKLNMLSYSKRLEMVKLAFATVKNVSICDEQLLEVFQRNDMTNVLQILKRRHPKAQFYQVLGDDVLERPEVSLKDDGEVNYLVAHRNGQATLPVLRRSKIQMFKLDSDLECSSSKVRAELKQGIKQPECLAPSVAKYISHEHLYQ